MSRRPGERDDGQSEGSPRENGTVVRMTLIFLSHQRGASASRRLPATREGRGCATAESPQSDKIKYFGNHRVMDVEKRAPVGDGSEAKHGGEHETYRERERRYARDGLG